MGVLNRVWVAFFLLLAGVIAGGACGFEPNIADGAFACAADRSCPSGFTCAADGRCYRPGAGPGSDAGPGVDAGPNGPLPVILVADVSRGEGNDPSGVDLAFVARLVPASDREVRIDYATVDDTAKAGSDYVAAKGTIVFPPGATSQTVAVKVLGDRIVEGDETFFLALSNASNATLDAALPNGRAKATITDDDTKGLVIDDVTVTEGDTGTTNADFVVTLTGAYPNEITVVYETQDGTATTPLDYTPTSGTLTFAPGETTKTVSVPIVGDLAHESDKTFSLVLSNVVGEAPLLDGTGKCTIKDNDPLPAVTIDDASVTEGNDGTVTMGFSVKLSQASGEPVKVSFASGGGTANAADYSAASGALTFDPGQTTKTISVQVNGDTIDEDNETFEVTLSAPVGATLGGKAKGVGTILDDDEPPVVSIEGVSLPEGNAGTKTFPFTVRLSAASSKAVTVAYATSNGSATAGSDYVAATGNVVVPAGQTTATINVTVNGDTLDEGVETFTVTLSNPTNATLGTATATGTLLNDDSQDPRITIDDVTVDETAGVATFTLSLACPTPCPGGVSQVVTVDYATADLTATAGADYVAITGGQVSFPSFTTTATIDVAITDDLVYEPTETFAVNLTGATGGTIFDAQGIGTITSDEGKPSLAIAPAADSEGNVGTKTFAFDVTLSGPASTDVTVSYATTAGTATAGTDYTTTSGTLTFAPGEVAKTVNVSVIGDNVFELDETFSVGLSAPSANATIATASATGTILNDETQPTLSINDVSIGEGNSGTKDMTFTVTLSGPSSQAITVDYVTANDTATAGSDFSNAAGTLTFAPGTALTRTITVVVSGDNVIEPNETFFVNLANPTNVLIAKGQGVGTITNDDSRTVSIGDATASEGNALTFTLTLSKAPPAGEDVTVDWSLVDVTTSADDHGATVSGTVTFTGTQTSRTITVTTVNDTLDEVNETFEIHLSNPSANVSIFDGTGVGTINDNDPTPSLSYADNTITKNENDSGTSDMVFTVRLSAASGRTVAVDYATSDGSATSSGTGRDYEATNGTLTFPPGTTQLTIAVPIRGDKSKEGDETFRVYLSNPVGATLPSNPYYATGTIKNDD